MERKSNIIIPNGISLEYWNFSEEVSVGSSIWNLTYSNFKLETIKKSHPKVENSYHKELCTYQKYLLPNTTNIKYPQKLKESTCEH